MRTMVGVNCISDEAGVWQPGQERLARRRLVDREGMLAVYDAKPLAYKCTKRVFDVAVSVAGLVVLSPIMAATALAIMIEDGRPVICAVLKEGQDGRPFQMYRFRSMHRDAEAKPRECLDKNARAGSALKEEDDLHMTKVGAFIRRASIDGIPQFWNILRGEMSVVGPMATQRIGECTPHEMQRLIAKPGLICYRRAMNGIDMCWEDWVELDLDYVQNMGVLTDLRLIARTMSAALHAKGVF